jgi:HPt (histidine-containing phosphotransfer) domain-containing protein
VSAVSPEHLAAIDASIVRSLRQLSGSPDLYPQLVAMFSNASRATLLQIRGALEVGNLDDVTAYSHRLKGAAANVGALACSKHLAELETTSRRHDATGAQSLYDELERALPQLLNELELASMRAAA